MFWETKKSEKENEKIAADYSQIAEDLGDRRLLFRFLWICLTGNIIIWLCVFLIPNLVYKFSSLIFGLSDKIGMSLLGVPFGFGLFFAYCLARLKFPDVEDDNNLESEMMSSFNYQTRSTKRWFIWLFSILAGVTNVVFLVLTTLVLSGQI